MTIDFSKFPKKPGVYLMKDVAGKVIYVGKAIHLQKRLKQYFLPGRDSRPQIPLLVAKIEDIETIVVSSEKEALLLEHSLIKKHHPRYNFLLKDDKSFICLQITKGPWPALKLVRSKDVKPQKDVFGPYPSAYAARKLLNLLQRLFPLRECSDYVLRNRTRPCILHQIGRCIAPCVDKCSKEEYSDFVNQVRSFLKGQDQTIVKELHKKMKIASEDMEYEKAQHYLETMEHIESLLEKQNVISQSKIDCDILGLYREGGFITLSLLIFQKGRLIDSQTFPMFDDFQEDEDLISSFIIQYYLEKKEFPHEILVPLVPSSIDALTTLINENSPHLVKIMSPLKGSKKDLLQMAYDNAQSAFQKEQKQSHSREELLLDLKDKLKLSNYPEVIECYDNSHIAGSNPVSVMISFVNGIYDKSRVRKYHLSTEKVFDDLKGFEEVLLRRFRNQDLPFPDLIIVDGGKTQLNVAQKTLKELNIINVDLFALTKEKGRHDFGMSQERVFLPGKEEPIVLSRKSNLLFLLQSIRDQSHKFAITFHRKTRKKSIIKSVLDQIAGIGPKKKKALITHFGSPKRVQEATVDELKEVSLLTKSDIVKIQEFFASQ